MSLKFQEISQMQMVDAVDAAAACPLVKADNVFWIVVMYRLQIAKLPLTGKNLYHVLFIWYD